MNHEIAQMVALTCYGNACLQGRDIPQFYPGNSTTQFCESITFVEVEKPLLGKQRESEIARSPDEWFTCLKAKGAKGVQLRRQAQNVQWLPDRMSAGLVGGGGSWFLEVYLPKDQCESWITRWEVNDQDAADRRIWRVTYRQVSSRKSKPVARRNLQDAGEGLLKALQEIGAFSEKHQCGSFSELFSNGIASLDRSGRHGYHQDLAPAELLSPEAAEILDACQSAWVFGGMGSWNDLFFDGQDKKDYEQVSEQLYLAIMGAIQAAANSTSILPAQ